MYLCLLNYVGRRWSNIFLIYSMLGLQALNTMTPNLVLYRFVVFVKVFDFRVLVFCLFDLLLRYKMVQYLYLSYFDMSCSNVFLLMLFLGP